MSKSSLVMVACAGEGEGMVLWATGNAREVVYAWDDGMPPGLDSMEELVKLEDVPAGVWVWEGNVTLEDVDGEMTFHVDGGAWRLPTLAELALLPHEG